jgi:hypothetical protein
MSSRLTATAGWLTAKLLPVLASTVILSSESHGTHENILLSYGSGSPQTTLVKLPARLVSSLCNFGMYCIQNSSNNFCIVACLFVAAKTLPCSRQFILDPLFRFLAIISQYLSIQGVNVSRDSIISIATGYGLDDPGVGVLVPVGSRIFSSPPRPNRLCGPSSLLSKG